MTRSVRWTLAAAIAIVVSLVGGVGFQAGSAAPLEATWSIYNRANTTPFVVGTPGGSGGYEIVSFAAAGPTDALDTYVYAGPDLVPPMPPLVTCAATMQPATVELNVGNGYPYAGCVYFLGVSNTGSNPIRVDLGSLEANATATCNVSGCQRSDIDIVAGGRTAAEVGQFCSGPATLTGPGLRYTIAPGDTFVCPLFVVVLQPAKENATYRIEIVPPDLDDENQEFETPTPTATEGPRPTATQSTGTSGSRPSIVSTPTPTVVPAKPAEPTATPTPAPSPTPMSTAAGARTPGANATPLAPSTGSGVLVQRGGGHTVSPLIVIAGGLLAIWLVLAWPDRRR